MAATSTGVVTYVQRPPHSLSCSCIAADRTRDASSALQVTRVRCEASGVLVPKDKAIKRFIVRNIVDASAIRDIQESSVIDGAPFPLACCCDRRHACV